MSTVIDQPRNDVPIVTDATLLAVPNMNDEKAKGEYLAKIRALRNPPSAEAAPTSEAPAATPAAEPAEELPDTDEPVVIDEPSEDAIQPETSTTDTPSNRTRLSKEDLVDYEIPVIDEDGNTVYLSYDEFNKTVGTYSKQNKKLRELADREREVEAIKTNLLAEQNKIVQQATNQELKFAERYQWIQNSLAHAAKYGVDVVEFDDGSSKKVTQLIAEKTAVENAYNNLQMQKQQAQQNLSRAQEEFIKSQDAVLEERAPGVKKARADISKFLERQGFTSEEANVLAHAKAELLIVFDKAMKYENAKNSQSKEKKVSQNTKVLKQPSRLAGRGTPQNSVPNSRMAELQSLGTKATPDQLRELRRLQLQNR